MQSLSPRLLKHPKTGLEYCLVSADQLPARPQHEQQFARICNQDDVYKLFERGWQGRSYTVEDARWYLAWAIEGWLKKSHFVFLLCTAGHEIAASMAIKSNSLDSAEIGYWCDQDHRGITGAAVKLMMHWAHENGFKQVFALSLNPSSARLLQNQGFTKSTVEHTAHGDIERWVKSLV